MKKNVSDNKNNTQALKWDLQLAGKVWPGIALLSFVAIAYAVITAVFALVSKSVVDTAVDILKGNKSAQLISSFVILAVMVLLQLGLQIAITELSVRIGGRVNILCQKKLFSDIIHREAGKVLKYHTGDLMTRLTSDISVVSGAVSSIIPDLLHYISRAIACFWVLITLDKEFALVCLFALPVILVTARIYRDKIKVLHKNVQESDGKIRSFMQETLSNLLVIKSFSNENKVVANAGRLQEKNFRLTLKKTHITILVTILFILAMTAIYYLALAWGAFRLSKNLITFGTLTAILQLVEQLQVPFRNLSSVFPRYYAMIASTERILEIENLPEENFDEIEFDKNDIYNHLVEIRAENVSFSYGNVEVLKNINLSLKKGDFASVMGISGAGKSTFLKLFLGIMEPDEGEIYMLLDNNEKIKLTAQTRSIFSYVPQGNLILSGTIRENIAFANDDATEEEIISAAKIAEIWDDICDMPDGLDTVLGESGMGMSEGQIQRLAIARAILYDSPILLLDECTSALDEKTERAVLKNLISLNKKSCLTISHKTAAKECCNVNLFMDGGQIYRAENLFLSK